VAGASSGGDTASKPHKGSSSSSKAKAQEPAEDELASTSKVGTDVLQRLK
jgi:hypothetical protein